MNKNEKMPPWQLSTNKYWTNVPKSKELNIN